MQTFTRRSLLLVGAAALGAAVLPSLALAQATPGAPAKVANRAVFQVTDDEPARWNLVLNNMSNLQDGVGAEGVEIELVVFGPGIAMLKAGSPVKQRIAAALKSGMTISACQNTMSNAKLTPADMLPAIGYVPAGVVEVMRKQQQGWAYIRS